MRKRRNVRDSSRTMRRKMERRKKGRMDRRSRLTTSCYSWRTSYDE